MSIESFIRHEAATLGFAAVGFVAVGPAQSFDRFQEWLDRGYAGEMYYLVRHAPLRSHPAQLAPYARTVIVVAARYPAVTQSACWSNYALGRDYHEVLRARLKQLEQAIRGQSSSPLLARICVDTAPLLEREWACRAGLGWIGRQGSLVHPEYGCCLFLGELLVNLELEPSPPVPSQCGDCRLCVEACPTGAIQPDGFLDARRCIACLTIEHQGAIPESMRPLIGTSLFGCDRCTVVCPWSRKGIGLPAPRMSGKLLPYGTKEENPPLTPPGRGTEVKLPSWEGPGVGSFQGEVGIMSELAGAALPLPSPSDCLAMSESDFDRRFSGTVVQRLGLSRLQRNAVIVMENAI